MKSVSIFLALIGLALVGIGAWLATGGAFAPGALSVGVGAACAAAGWGIYKRRRWGVALFGLLGLAGSINFLAVGLLQAGGAVTTIGMANVAVGLVLATGLGYLTIRLWRDF